MWSSDNAPTNVHIPWPTNTQNIAWPTDDFQQQNIPWPQQQINIQQCAMQTSERVQLTTGSDFNTRCFIDSSNSGASLQVY
jgi:hypothetical protein